jgi:hypothetical protein
MFHTVYLSFEDGKVGRDYIGKHSGEDPYDEYLGSYKDKSFNPKGKIILEYAKTEEGAVEAEIRWQQVFKVAEDPQFVNQSYQNTSRFKLSSCSEEILRRREQSLRDYYSSEEGFKTQGDKTRGKVWYHLPGGREQRFDRNPGKPWIQGRNENLGNIVKHNLDHAAGGAAAGKLPWWYNPSSKERRRQIDSPGEGWENRKGPNNPKG